VVAQPLDPAGIRHPVQPVVTSFALELATAELRENFSKIFCKILLRACETSFTGFKVFYDCSGGNSRPSRLSGVGGGNFLGTNARRFILAPVLLLLDCV